MSNLSFHHLEDGSILVAVRVAFEDLPSPATASEAEAAALQAAPALLTEAATEYQQTQG